MGQTPAGSSGDLELLERIKKSESGINDLSHSTKINFTTVDGTKVRMTKNNAILNIYAFTILQGTNLYTAPQISIGNANALYMIGKIENKNPFSLADDTIFDLGKMTFFMPNGFNIRMMRLYIGYDGENTYLLTDNTAISAGNSDAYGQNMCRFYK